MHGHSFLTNFFGLVPIARRKECLMTFTRNQVTANELLWTVYHKHACLTGNTPDGETMFVNTEHDPYISDHVQVPEQDRRPCCLTLAQIDEIWKKRIRQRQWKAFSEYVETFRKYGYSMELTEANFQVFLVEHSHDGTDRPEDRDVAVLGLK